MGSVVQIVCYYLVGCRSFSSASPMTQFPNLTLHTSKLVLRRYTQEASLVYQFVSYIIWLLLLLESANKYCSCNTSYPSDTFELGCRCFIVLSICVSNPLNRDLV